MFISDLETGAQITLSVKIGTENVEFISKVQETMPKKHAILAEVVKDNDKVVSFNGNNVFVDVYFHPSDNSPIVFRNVKILLYKDMGGSGDSVTDGVQGMVHRHAGQHRGDEPDEWGEAHGRDSVGSHVPGQNQERQHQEEIPASSAVGEPLLRRGGTAAGGDSCGPEEDYHQETSEGSISGGHQAGLFSVGQGDKI